MFSKFHGIDEAKRERIINAALKEFAARSYTLASTNTIAGEAGISKGILFHYFGSKKGLYLYLCDYSIEVLTAEVNRDIDFGEKDLFKRLRQVAGMELAIFNKHPDMFPYLKMVYMEDAEEVRMEIYERTKRFAASEYQRMFADIDSSGFRDGLDVNRVINVVLWTLEGMGEQERARAKALGRELDMDAVMEEFEHYLDMFQRSFCK